MASKNTPIENNQIEPLLRYVEEVYGSEVSSPKQFEGLSKSIFDKTRCMLSSSTLKRLWGYVDVVDKPRRSTLDVLAHYCGWKNYTDFLSGSVREVESGPVGTDVIRVDSIEVGCIVRLMWSPGRVCDIKYLGDMKWEVVYSEQTRLSKGDTFSCAMIVKSEPLYLDELIHNGKNCGVYVCGRRSGVSFSVECI